MNKVVQLLKRNIFIRAGSILSVYAVALILILIPMHQRTTQMEKQVEELLVNNQKIQHIMLAGKHSGEQLEIIKKRLEKYKTMIPERSRLSEVLDNIAKRAQGDGLEVLSLKPVKDGPLEGGKDRPAILTRPNDELYEIVINMKANAQFFELGQYLSDLEKAPYMIVIKQVQVDSPGKVVAQEREPELSVSITMAIMMIVSS